MRDPIVIPSAPLAPSYRPQAKAPASVALMRTYAATTAVLSLLALVFAIAKFVTAAAPSPLVEPGTIAGFYEIVAAATLLPSVLVTAGRRKRWTHTLGYVVLGITMLAPFCWPMAIPLLVVWMKPETQEWFSG
jgi:hypothetical protein